MEGKAGKSSGLNVGSLNFDCFCFIMRVSLSSSSVISSSFSIRMISKSFFPFAVNEPSCSIVICSVTIFRPISVSVALTIHLSFFVLKSRCDVICVASFFPGMAVG